MGVVADWQGELFERKFFDAIDKELVKSSLILRRALSKVLAKTGKSPPSSPEGSPIPYNRTGNLAGSWHSVTKSRRTPTRYIAGIHTNTEYAWDLYIKGKEFNNKRGGRNFMDENLYWYQKVSSLINKRLEPKRLVKVASRDIFPN